MAELHDKYPPVVYSISEHNNPAWQLLKYEDTYFVLRHPEFFTSAGSGRFPRDPDD